jgi:N-acetylneuraminic acid mutarotase
MEKKEDWILGSTIEILRVINPLDKTFRESLPVPYVSSKTLLAYRDEHLPLEIDFIASISGKVVPKEKWGDVVPSSNDQLVFVPVIEDAKAIVGIATFVAVIIAAVAGQAAMIPWILAIGSALSLAASLLFPTKIKEPGTADQTQVYSFQPQTLQQAGPPIPRWYGTNKLYGNIIGSYRTEFSDPAGDHRTINSLICLGMGPFSAVNEMKINDQDVTTIWGVRVKWWSGAVFRQMTPDFSYFNYTYPFNSSIVEYPVSVEIRHAYGYNRAITGGYTYETNGDFFDGLRIQLEFPSGIWGCNDDGYFEISRSVSVYTTLEDGSQPWINVFTTNFFGCRTTNMMYTFDIPLYFGKGRYKIKIIKNSVDLINGMTNPIDDSGTYQWDPIWSWGESVYLAAVQEIYSSFFSYPRQVVVAISAWGSGTLSGSIKFSCVADCLLIRTTTDGVSWSVEFSNNPAWVAFDILTQPVLSFQEPTYVVARYEGINPTKLMPHIQDWLNLASYCDELVSDGVGGTEKRHTFNGGFDTETTPYDAAQQVLATARSFLMPSGNGYRIVIDRPRNRTQVFNTADMRPDSYQCTWLSLADRVSKLEAANFVEASKDYKQAPLAVFNPYINDKALTKSIDLTGITRRTAGWRYLNYHLKYNQYVLRTHSFQVDSEAIVSEIGDRIDIQDEIVSYIESGRVVSSTSSTVTLDTPVIILSGVSYMITIKHDDSSVEDVEVTSGSGTYTTLSIAPNTFIQNPTPVDDAWILSNVTYGASGRVVAGTANSVTLDKQVVISTNVTYKITVRHDDDTLEELLVTSGPGIYETISTSPYTFVQNPQPLIDTWVFGEQTTYLKSVVIADKETNEDTRETTLNCIDYDARIYDDSAMPSPIVDPVIGGRIFLGLGSVSSVLQKDWWVYDMGTDVWVQKPDFAGDARRLAVAASVGNIYVGLGESEVSGDPYDCIDWWEYNIITDVWTQKEDYPGTSVAGSMLAAGVLNKAYIICASCPTYLKECWEYDSSTDVWTQKDRWYSDNVGIRGAVIVSDGIDVIYVGLGENIPSALLYDWWEYIISIDSWGPLADYPGVGGKFPVAGWASGKAYVGLGHENTDWWEYTPWDSTRTTGNTWTQKTSFPGTVNAVYDESTLVASSINNLIFVGVNQKEWWKYDPSDDSWTAMETFGGFSTDWPSCAPTNVTYKMLTLSLSDSITVSDSPNIVIT